jgi:TRAP-type C4-dicarboxylate transport system substrate-binding protein
MKALKSLLLAGAVVMAGQTLAGQAFAQAKELQISTWLPPTHSLHKQMEEWAKEIETETSGSLDVNIYPSSQLGAAPDHYDMVRDGIVEMSIAAPTLNTGRFPIWSLVEIPFTFANTKSGARAFHEWYAEYAEKEMPEVMLCMTTIHHPGALNFNKPNIRIPTDLKGLRIRPGGATLSEWISAQGATPVPSSLPEVKELADRGAIDGVTLPWDMVLFGIHTAMPYHIDEPFYVGGQAWVINKDFYAGLTDVEKASIDKHCGPEWSEKLSGIWYDNMREFRQQLIDDKTQFVYQLNADERKLWVDTAAPVAEKAKAAVTGKGYGNAAEILDGLRAKLKEHGALVE